MGLTVFDAGVIVGALDGADVHHEACVDALRVTQGAGDDLLLPASAYAECLVWPFRAGDVAVRDADAFIDALPATVVAADRRVGRTAARLRAEHGRSLRLPDALVVATAIEMSASRILTTDQGWPEVEGIAIQVVGAAGVPGPDPAEITAWITSTYPDTIVGESMGAMFFSLDESQWPNFATIVTTDEHDMGNPSDLARVGVFRLNIGVGKATFERLVGAIVEPDHVALDTILPHPVYARQRWLSVLNPSRATFDDIVKPLIAEAYQRLARARQP